MRAQEPDLWDSELERDTLPCCGRRSTPRRSLPRPTFPVALRVSLYADMREYLGYVADSRLERLGIGAAFHCKNPFSFMELQDVQS